MAGEGPGAEHRPGGAIFAFPATEPESRITPVPPGEGWPLRRDEVRAARRTRVCPEHEESALNEGIHLQDRAVNRPYYHRITRTEARLPMGGGLPPGSLHLHDPVRVEAGDGHA